MLKEIDWVIDMVRDKGIDTPKTIIFCPTINGIATLVNYLMMKLDENAFHPCTSKKRESCLIGIFHSLTLEQYKKRISTCLKSSGIKRIVIATTALSMGVNFPDIRYIIMWGPPRNILDFHQEAGRAGRDGLSSDVILYYYGQQVTHCEDDLRLFLKTDGCHRVSAYSSLDPQITPLQPPHDCCRVCSLTCTCEPGGCTRTKAEFEEREAVTHLPANSRHVSAEDKTILVEALHELKNNLNATVPITLFGTTAVNGFSDELIEDVAENCSSIFSVEDVFTYAPVFLLSHAINIMEIINDLFGDCDETTLNCEDGDIDQLVGVCSVSEYRSDFCDEDEGDL